MNYHTQFLFTIYSKSAGNGWRVFRNKNNIFLDLGRIYISIRIPPWIHKLRRRTL